MQTLSHVNARSHCARLRSSAKPARKLRNWETGFPHIPQDKNKYRTFPWLAKPGISIVTPLNGGDDDRSGSAH